jgi:acetylornithine deacetylase
MAAMLAAFARLVRERPEGSASVLMACTVDEEFTHTGASHLAASRPGVDLAIVAEPTRLELVDCHKGAVRWRVRAKGVACHSSTPHLGKNAIYRMAGIVARLAEYASDLAQAEADPVLGPPTFSVGRIEGGVSVNVVPDWCEIEVDRRLIPGEKSEQTMGVVHAWLLQGLGAEAEKWIDFSAPFVDFPSLASTAATSGRWQERVGAALEPVLGHQPGVSGVPYGTDAGPLGATGLACLVFGPGDIAQAHTRDEWVELDQIRLAADAYYQIACRLGRD